MRARGDDELRALLSARPELLAPVPADLTALAARAATPAAVSRALDRLDRFTLAVLEALLVLPSPGRAGRARHRPRLHARASLRRARHAPPLRARLGERRAEHRARRPAGPAAPGRARPARPGGLRDLPRRAADRPRHRPGRGAAARVHRLRAAPAPLADLLDDPGPLIDDAGPDARAALEQLAWGPPVGRVADARRPVRIDTAATPIERLLARGLLAAEDDRTVTLPREIALHLRGGRLVRDVPAEPPPLPPAAAARGEDAVVRAAAGEAYNAVRLTEELLERWGLEPPPVLRSGGLAVRDLRAAATLLDVPEWKAALLVEVAYAAGLLTRSGDLDGEWLPTPAYDLWLMRDTAGRWTELARGWLKSDRAAGLAGERDDRDRLINALSEAMVRSSAPATRQAVLDVLVGAGRGVVVGEDALRERLTWLRPRRGGPIRDRLLGWTLREAAALGLTGFGEPAPFARDLLAGDDPEPTLEKYLPAPVDEILIQADLTAIAPGPLVTDLARELALAADVESTGGATVYRFTPESIRRALDAGRTAADVTDLLSRHSATSLPQPLTYLIDDVARRHGHLRVGALTSYVRTDAPATLDEILADRRAAPLRLHRLAPTVLASGLQRADLLDGLRAMGLAPVAEAPGGGVIVTRPDAQRAEPPPTAEIVRLRPGSRTDDTMIAAAVRALRAGDEASVHGAEQARQAPSGEPPRSPAMATIELLRAAVERGGRVWIGYLDQQGQASSRIVEPVRVEGGFLTGYDATRAAVHRFALHRITGVKELDDAS
ncbi:helicase-associated domain-containing protein [Actinomadura madurae]|uniref:helicase-associated domain-containing protein n=1 Tax=Actinomadura madurae TaxID=1993 RepID=UPI0020D218EE|nr:helicase-associated domain-containing protein [Actinomadura madurae]MCP9982447.1 helicase-associated domain-containing protein [Actinomadura madurae]